MRYRDLKLVESNLAVSQLLNRPGRVQTFLQKIQSGQDFQLKDGGSVKIDPSEYDRAKQFLVPGSKGTLNLKTVDGNVISTSKLAKTAEFGGTAAGSKDEGIKFNRGEVIEGYHALAAFVRLQARPSRDITLEEVVKWIPKIKNNETFKLPVKDSENKDITDEFHLTISLKPGTWEAFQRPQEVLKDPKLKSYVKDVIDDANAETGPKADAYASNGRYDLIRVVGDGVSGERETKTDINFENETEKKYRGYSIKAGTTAQIHQVGGGKKIDKPEEKFRILQDELFGVHGLARLADISGVRDEFIKALGDNSIKSRLNAQSIAYRAAVDSLNDKLNTDNEEKVFVKTLAKALKFFLARDDDNILLKQFSGTGTWILDPKNFDRLHEQGLDLVAEYIGRKTNPEIIIKDQFSGMILVQFRTYESGGYLRNYIEKGELFKELTDLKKAKSSKPVASRFIDKLRDTYDSRSKLTPAQARQVQDIINRLSLKDLKTIANANIRWVSDAAKKEL